MIDQSWRLAYTSTKFQLKLGKNLVDFDPSRAEDRSGADRSSYALPHSRYVFRIKNVYGCHVTLHVPIPSADSGRLLTEYQLCESSEVCTYILSQINLNA